ncbi:hypothetical protein D9V34_02045 [Mycetocola lacteus]|uniref:Uncharacterized protein n=1 Tax=Mycetocola lacteus TaxID=76637 RepID=A0A3L7AZ36_9MICO|nr:hypothetical protein [Mycetocola lacteus]RLP84801.1 hypothetical protein D9V34_02045 [Mycetocola lacteus]
MSENTSEPIRRVPGSRRVRTAAVPGSDPAPQAGTRPVRAAEDSDAGWGDKPAQTSGDSGNDARMRADVPPHWGTHTR